MPRGRKPRVATATLPPKSYYTGHLAPLAAVREGRVSPVAAHLWAVIRAHAWRDGRCDLSDRELGAWMGGLGERQIRNLRAELAGAGLLATSRAEPGGPRWLAPQPAMEGKSISPESDLPPNGPVKEEEVNDVRSHPPPPPAGEIVFRPKPSPPDPAFGVVDPPARPAAALARFLAGHGAFPSVAASLAGDLLARMAPEEAQVHSLALLAAVEADARSTGIGGERVLGRWVARLRDGANPPEWAVREAVEALAAAAADGLSPCPSPAREVGDGAGSGPAREGDEEVVGASEPEADGEPDLAPEERPWIVYGSRACSHEELWHATLSQLRLQLPGSTFDTWLAASRCTGADCGGRTLVVRVRGGYAAGWLTLRLKPLVLRTVAALTGQGDLDVRFEEA